jgi:hydroxyacylglutathione hydrolase
MTHSELTITAIPAFEDNYIWLIRKGGTDCAIVDPGDHLPVVRYLEDNDLTLKYILLTHHHWDHTGGVKELVSRYSPMVIGPTDPRFENLSLRVSEGDHFQLREFDLDFTVIEIPGHTSSHIAFTGNGLLFCGDTLFSIGCGRLFEGTPEQMQESLDKIAALASETLVYCAHEYTQSNCAFALEVEPENKALLLRTEQVNLARSKHNVTIPSTLAEELAANPFLRTRVDSVISAAREIQPNVMPGAETLAVIRAWKDNY